MALKAAFVSPGLWPGGAERWTASLIRHSDPARIQWTGVCVFNISGADGNLCREIAALTPLHGVRRPSFGGPAADCFTLLHETFEGAVRAAARGADFFVGWGSLHYDYLREYGKPLVWVSHSTRRFEGKRKSGLPPETHLASVSEAGKTFFEGCRGAEGMPVEVIWNGADEERSLPRRGRDAQRLAWGAGRDTKVIGYLGRLSAEKNYRAAALALSALPDHYTTVYYGHAGGEEPGRFPEDLEALMKIHPRRLLAFPPEPFVGDILAGFDCLMNASREESFSLSMIEAWLAGTPVVTTPTGTPLEFTRRFGPLTVAVPFDPSPEVLADAVIRATGPEGRDIAARARQVAFEHLTARKMAGRWMDYFEKVMKSPAAALK